MMGVSGSLILLKEMYNTGLINLEKLVLTQCLVYSDIWELFLYWMIFFGKILKIKIYFLFGQIITLNYFIKFLP